MRKLRISNRWRLFSFLLFILAPGALIGYFTHSWAWLILWPGLLIALMLVAAALPIKRKITPQKWADQLQRHLDGKDVYAWDDATSAQMADPRMERLCRYIIDGGFYRLDFPERRDELTRIIEALRRGEIPNK